MKIVNIFLPISLNICYGCYKDLSHWDGSFEYPQHTFWLRNKKISFFDTHSFDFTKFLILTGVMDDKKLIGRVINLRSRGRWFEPHRMHLCVHKQDTLSSA